MQIDLKECTVEVTFSQDNLNSFFADRLEKKLIIVDNLVLPNLSILAPNINAVEADELLLLPGRKESKTIRVLLKIFEILERVNFPRSGTIVAIGGGVIGDIAGLAASLWYRGCNLVHIPTTLLAAVDSCLGGKTAVNFGKTINALGSYHHASNVIIEPKLFSTLTARDLRSGMAEVVKYTVLGNKNLSSYIGELKIEDLRNEKHLSKIIEMSLSQKARYVEGDVKERNKRLYLNLGHTLGHALEISTIIDGTERLRHGEGVSLGLMAVSNIALKLGKLHKNGLKSVESKLQRFGLPTKFDPTNTCGLEKSDFIKICTHAAFRDKKRSKNRLKLIIPVDYAEGCEIFETQDASLISYGLSSILG